jgi:hypothetical protein
MPEIGLHAFIDESGQRARTKRSSAHFVLTAAIVPAAHLADAAAALAQLRKTPTASPANT